MTMHEQMILLKSHCFFVTFMPNKPDKYDVKFWILAVVKAKYVCNIDVYLGAPEREQRGGAPLAKSVVMKLYTRKYVKGKKYNITSDHFFSSTSLAEKLANDKLSIVGIM